MMSVEQYVVCYIVVVRIGNESTNIKNVNASVSMFMVCLWMRFYGFRKIVLTLKYILIDFLCFYLKIIVSIICDIKTMTSYNDIGNFKLI